MGHLRVPAGLADLTQGAAYVVILQGDGPATTTISASGTCGSGMCAVEVAGAGSIELGPNISASNNGAAGVESPQSATGILHVIGSANAFVSNMANGLNLDGSAVLNFEGGSANANFQGIRLAGTAPSGHTITGLTAKNNRGPGGVVAYRGQTLKMRSSTLLGNAAVGLLYDYVNGSTLDIGTPSDPGGNVFGGATFGNRNAAAGIELCGAPGPGAQNAEGDQWASCPPTQTAITCGGALGAYADVAYQPAIATVNPVLGTPCTVGP